MKTSRLFVASISVVSFLFSLANAEIPAGYAGTPFPPGSAPRELNGRINFNEYDLGGKNVAWYQDDAWDGAPNRKGIDEAGPAFYETCTAWDRDTFYADGVSWPNGVLYPDPTDTTIHDFYIGAAHANTFVKWTVHVSKAGKYWISAYWSAMDVNLAYTVSLLNGTNTTTTGLISKPAITQSYHAWRRFADFASIQADTGVQVLYFQDASTHLNQDYLYFASDSGKFPPFPNSTAIAQPALKPAKAESPSVSISQNTIRFTLNDAGMTKVSVFDCLGKEVSQIIDRNLAGGEHTFTFNTLKLKQGVYFLHITHNGNAGVVRFQNLK
jgi:hypothetical protein